jgi:hypothetical protein
MLTKLQRSNGALNIAFYDNQLKKNFKAIAEKY